MSLVINLSFSDQLFLFISNYQVYSHHIIKRRNSSKTDQYVKIIIILHLPSQWCTAPENGLMLIRRYGKFKVKCWKVLASPRKWTELSFEILCTRQWMTIAKCKKTNQTLRKWANAQLTPRWLCFWGFFIAKLESHCNNPVHDSSKCPEIGNSSLRK